MEFIDLKKQFRILESEIRSRMDRVLAHGSYIMGPEIAELESALSEFCGAKHCITLANGTDALLLALLALGVKAGDEVITTPFSFFATAEVMMLLGVKPVFVDIDKKTYNLDAKLLTSKITDKTKAIMPVSLYGQCADYKTINLIAEQYHLAVIEDGAQSFGAKHHGKYSGNLTTIGCTSFFPSKPLGCYGDGGACFTNDDQLAQTLRELRIHGQQPRYEHRIIGINARMDTLQAAILLAKLTAFPKEIELRKEIGDYYTQQLRSLVQTPYIEPFNTSVYAQYTIRTSNRSLLQEALKAKNIPTAIHYPKPIHLQPALALKGTWGHYPIAEKASKEVISLPMHPYLEHKDIDQMVDVIASVLEKALSTVQ